MGTVLLILLGILLFGVLIAVHEFGHFITAKLCGVRVNEFAIGMGPKLLSRQGKETVYTLRLFPIGGYCAMEGEDEDTDDPRSFQKAKNWKKFLILVAGAFMNFVAGMLIFLVMFLPGASYEVDIASGFEDWSTLPAQGLQVGDQFLKIDGHAILARGDASLFLNRVQGTIDIEVLRDGERVVLRDVDMTRTEIKAEDGTARYMLGIRLGGETRPAGVLDKLRLAWYNALDSVRLVWMSLGDLFTGAVGLRDLSGPVGIVDMMVDVAHTADNAFAAVGGILYLFGFIAVNLAVMNLLPIPALDGGRIFFLIINAIFTLFTKKQLNPKYEGVVNTVGFVLLLGLMVVVAVSDIFKLFGR